MKKTLLSIVTLLFLSSCLMLDNNFEGSIPDEYLEPFSFFREAEEIINTNNKDLWSGFSVPTKYTKKLIFENSMELLLSDENTNKLGYKKVGDYLGQKMYIKNPLFDKDPGTFSFAHGKAYKLKNEYIVEIYLMNSPTLNDYLNENEYKNQYEKDKLVEEHNLMFSKEVTIDKYIHELFHLYQEMLWSDREGEFSISYRDKLYKDNYIEFTSDQEQFIRVERLAIANAYLSEDREEVLKYIHDYLLARENKYKNSTDQSHIEEYMATIEGTATYVDSRSSKIRSEIEYRKNLLHSLGFILYRDFYKDYNFTTYYEFGKIQAEILNNVKPEWKDNFQWHQDTLDSELNSIVGELNNNFYFNYDKISESDLIDIFVERYLTGI